MSNLFDQKMLYIMMYITHCVLQSYLLMGRAALGIKREVKIPAAAVQAELFFVTIFFSVKLLSL